MTSAAARIVGPACSNSFQTHSPKSLNLLFSIYSKWLPCLCLLTHCLEPCPSFQDSFPPPQPRQPAIRAVPRYFSSSTHFLTLPQLWRPGETQMASSPSSAAGLGSSRARTAGSEVLPAQPWLLVSLQPHDFQIDFSTTLNSLQAPAPDVSSGKTLHCCCIHTLHSPSWTLGPYPTNPCFSVCSGLGILSFLKSLSSVFSSIIMCAHTCAPVTFLSDST